MKEPDLESYITERFLRDKALEGMLEKYLLELPKEQVVKLLLQRIKAKEQTIPISIFSEIRLSPLELIIKYLKEVIGLRNSEIAELLCRSQQVVWTTYNNASRKAKAPLETATSRFDLPIAIFRSDSYSVLETIVIYLKTECGLRYSDIARLTHRNERTIWTAYKRATRKDETE